MREVLRHRVQVLLGAILQLLRVGNDHGRSLFRVRVSLEVIDISRTEIMVNNMIGDQFLIGDSFPPS